jgi:hypothetical protein
MSSEEPRYWPSDRNKLPDLVYFCAIKGISQGFAVAKSCFDLSSDHSPILITLTANVLTQEIEPILSNKHTNWDEFRRLVNGRLTIYIPLKREEDIVTEASDIIQRSGWNATPEHKRALKAYDCPVRIKQKFKKQ